MPDLPKVSLILSSYNRPRLIRDAIDSVLEQEGVEVQLLVADDFSDQPTLQVLAGYIARLDTDMRVIMPEGAHPTTAERHQNGGGRCAKAINAAMEYATGEFVAFLPDDDWLTPNSLASRARFLVEHPEANAVYGRLESCKCATAVPRHRWVEDWGDAVAWSPGGIGCEHDRNGFWSADPIVRAANKVDHSMPMIRRGDDLPPWPVEPSAELKIGLHLWQDPESPLVGEQFDCPDAGWFYRLEVAGLGPFYSIPDVVVVKRYGHGHGHRTDPSVRE